MSTTVEFEFDIGDEVWYLKEREISEFSNPFWHGVILERDLPPGGVPRYVVHGARWFWEMSLFGSPWECGEYLRKYLGRKISVLVANEEGLRSMRSRLRKEMACV